MHPILAGKFKIGQSFIFQIEFEFCLLSVVIEFELCSTFFNSSHEFGGIVYTLGFNEANFSLG